MTHAFPTRRSSDLPRSAPRRGSTTGRRTSTRTGTRAARSPAPRPGSSRRAFPALLAALVLGVAHQPDLLHAGALQQHHRVHHLLVVGAAVAGHERSEEHTSELQSLMRISYAVFCLKKKTHITYNPHTT